MPKPSLQFPRFLSFGRSHSQKKPPQADSSNAIDVSSSSCLAQGGPAAAAQNISGDSANQITQPVASLVKSNSAQTLGQHSSMAPPPIHPASPSQITESDPVQHQGPLVVPRPSPATDSQPSLLSRRQAPPPQDENSGVLYVAQSSHESSNVSVEGNMNYINYNHTKTIVNSSKEFMAKLLKKTIPGAAFDSSARDPPPRCHPGTRLAIIAGCLEFIANCIGEKKMLWVVGAAGVGKSAIMQNVAESPLSSVSSRASIFLSINGRNDGTKAIITLVYQLAAKCEPYRQFIELEIARDPSLLQSLMSVQFKKFIIEPFIHPPLINPFGRILVIIDGLDECDKSHTQRELLQLISDVCLTYPSSPIVWIIASRPEPHITSFFSQSYIKPVYKKEEILVDSNEARNDVERFLRNELTKIQNEFSLNPRSHWPPEQDLWKLASASGGLFVYAHTVIKYIGDPMFGNPTSQLDDVLKVIDAHPLPDIPQEQHPMARLDELYAQILSKVPERIMVNTRRILLALVLDAGGEWNGRTRNFLVLCNWLGMTCDDAYAAIRHLRSVLDAPGRDKAHNTKLRSFHKSFIDYISNFARSGPSSDTEREADQLKVQCTVRILEQAPDGIDFGDIYYGVRSSNYSSLGRLARGPGTGANLSLTWPVDEEMDWNDNKTRLEMYKYAALSVLDGIRKGEPAFFTEFCIRFVIARWAYYNPRGFPLRELQNLVFEEPRRHEFLNNGLLKQVPAKVLNLSYIIWSTRLQFRRPTAKASNLSDPWEPSCTHKRAGHWGEGNEDWTTEFEVTRGIIRRCRSCCQRLKGHLENWKTRFPDHLTTILFTSTPLCFVEFQFVDPDDGVSEWTYRLVYNISADEQRKLGSSV